MKILIVIIVWEVNKWIINKIFNKNNDERNS